MLLRESILTIFCLTLLLVSGAVRATDIQLSHHTLHFDYEERADDGTSLDRETGFINGQSLSISQPFNRFNHRLQLEYYDGTVDYDGRLQSGQAHVTQTDTSLKRLAYKLNWFPLVDKSSSLYTDIAYQRWGRDIQANNDASGLFEQYEWWTVELGIVLGPINTKNHSLTFQGGIIQTRQGTILVDLSNEGFGKPRMDLGDATGISTEMIYSYYFNNRHSIQISLKHQQWEFEKSNTVSISNGTQTFSIVEPRSESNHTDLSVGYTMHF